jgi:2TM domain
MQTDIERNPQLDSGNGAALRNERSIEARARRRVARKMGFYIHALMFVLVNAGLFAINAVTGEPRWAHFPLLGWGVGLAIHGIVTFIGLQGEGVRQSMVKREIEQLRRSAS